MDFLDNKSDLMKALDEYSKRAAAVRKLPEYDEYVKLVNEVDGFNDYIFDKRKAEAHKMIEEILKDEKLVESWLERVSKLRKRLSDIQWKKGVSFCETNVMDFVWEVFSKYGQESNIQSMFGGGGYTIGKYTMEIYYGQGEYGYSIYQQKRIY